ncbi:O-methyltransferase [Chloroflexota bacterium]
MKGSYERINYSLRPAKSIERKMLCDAFRRLSEFGSVESYRYVGFGSPYFSDFYLFHKQLGFTNMISIERDEVNRSRFEFNRPFNCIDIEFGHSSEVLPLFSWDVRTIIWLDYDGRLDASVLTDVDFVCKKALPGSVIIISVNAQPDRPAGTKRVDLLKDHVGEDNVPRDISDGDLAGWGTARVYRRIITNTILQTLNDRNGGRASGSKIEYQQLFNFHYADGAKMLTIGGLLYDEGQAHMVAKCAFNDLSFAKMEEEAYRIDIPCLTYREIRHLDLQLPPSNEEMDLGAPGVPQRDIKKYEKLYRYFPTFAETET